MDQKKFIYQQCSNLFCQQNNSAKLLCCKEKCKNFALICRLQSCHCLIQNHQNCEFVYTESLIKKIKKKKKTISKQLQQSFKGVEKIYESTIDQLSKDRQKLIAWRQNYGLSLDQIKFVNAIIENNKIQLIGDLVYKIKMEIDQKDKSIDYFWKQQQQSFNKLQQLTNFYKNILSQPPILQLDQTTYKFNNFKINSKINTVQKVSGGNNWHFIATKQPLPKSPKSNFEIKIMKSPNKNILFGVTTETGKQMKSVYQSSQSICYYAYDGNIFEQGIRKNGGKELKQEDCIKVEVNRVRRRIIWTVNGDLLGEACLSQKFMKEKIYPFIEVYSIGNSIIISKSKNG